MRLSSFCTASTTRVSLHLLRFTLCKAQGVTHDPPLPKLRIHCASLMFDASVSSQPDCPDPVAANRWRCPGSDQKHDLSSRDAARRGQPQQPGIAQAVVIRGCVYTLHRTQIEFTARPISVQLDPDQSCPISNLPRGHGISGSVIDERGSASKEL